MATTSWRSAQFVFRPIALFVAVLIASAGLFGAPSAFATPVVKIGTGSTAGIYIVLGRAICKAIKLYTAKVDCIVSPTKGSVDNIKGLADGRFDIVIAQSDVHHHAVKGHAMFRKVGPQPALRSLFSAHQEGLAVIVKTNSDIHGLDDFPGKRINIGPDGSGTNTTMKMLFGKKRWKPSVFKQISTLPPKKEAASFCSGETDIFTYVIGHPSALVKMVLEKCPSRIIDIAGPAVDEIIKAYPYYAPTTILRNTYAQLDRDVKSVGMVATVMASTRLDDDIAYDVTAAVFSKLPTILTSSKVLLYLNSFDMVKRGLTAPLHDGARRYLQKTGRVK